MLRLQQRLTSHESIVTLQEVFEDEASVHLVMDFCSGGDLFDHITHHKRLSEREAAHVLRQLVTAVRCMHASGLVHRDLKPENVLLSRPRSQSSKGHPDVKVADFGLCVTLEPGQQVRGVAGSPFYMAPEVIRGKAYGPEVDVWSLGVILYTSLAGSLPFWGRGHEAVFAAVLRAKPDFVKKPWPLVSPEAKHLIRAMLNPEAPRRITLEAVLSHPWLLHNCPDLQAQHQHQQQQLQQHQQQPQFATYQLGNYRHFPHFIPAPQQQAHPSHHIQPQQPQEEREAQPQVQGQQQPGQPFLSASGLKQMISPLAGGTLFPASVGAGFSDASAMATADGLDPPSSTAAAPASDATMHDVGPAVPQTGPVVATSDMALVDEGHKQGAQYTAGAGASQEDSRRSASARRAGVAAPSSVVPPHLLAAPPAGSKRYGSPTWLVQLAAHRVEQANMGAATARGAAHRDHHSTKGPVWGGSHCEQNLRAGVEGGGVPGAHQDRDLHMIPSPPRVAVEASPGSSPSLLHRVQAALSLAHPFPRLYMPFTNSNYASPEMSPAQSRPLTPGSQASPALSPAPSPGSVPPQYQPPHSIFKDPVSHDVALYQRRGVPRPVSVAPARILPPGTWTLSGTGSGGGLSTVSTGGGTVAATAAAGAPLLGTGRGGDKGGGSVGSSGSDMDAEYASQQPADNLATQGVPRRDTSVALLAPKAGFPDAGSVPTPKMFGVLGGGKKGGPGGEVQGKENNLPAGAQQPVSGKASGYKKLSLFISSPSCLSPVGSVNMSTCDSLVERTDSEESVSSADPVAVTDTVTPGAAAAKAAPAIPCAGDKGSKGASLGLRNSLSPFALADSAVSALFSPGTSDRTQ